MYRPARRRKEPKQEKEAKKGLTREERLSLYDSMLYGIGARQTEEGERILARNRQIESPEDLKLLFIDYIDHLREQAEREIDIIPDVEGFCTYIGISRAKWKDLQGKKDFSGLVETINTSISGTQKQYGLKGIIPPLVLAMTFNNNFGYLSNVSTLEIRQNAQETGLPSKTDILASLPIDQEQENRPEN